MSDELEGTRHGEKWVVTTDTHFGHANAKGKFADYDGDDNRISIYNGWDLSLPARGIVPYDPKPDQVTLESIAHSLAMTPRFSGHTRYFYSIAQHSLYVAAHVPQDQRLRALLHDASEAYLTDIPSPYKMQIPGYKEVERRVTNAIGLHFGIEGLADKTPEIKAADRRALGHEANSFMPVNGDWYGSYYRQAIEDTKHLPPIDVFNGNEGFIVSERGRISTSMANAAYSADDYRAAVEYELARRDGDFEAIERLNNDVRKVYEKYHYPEPANECDKR